MLRVCCLKPRGDRAVGASGIVPRVGCLCCSSSGSLCVHILRVRYETAEEWRGLLKAQQETVRVSAFDPKVVADAYKRGRDAGNAARLVVQVSSSIATSRGSQRSARDPVERCLVVLRNLPDT